MLLGMTEWERRQYERNKALVIALPIEIRKALLELQKRGEAKGVEYGGGISVELVHEQLSAKQVISFKGKPGAVTLGSSRKSLLGTMIAFHTHPGQKHAWPSEEDIGSFIFEPRHTDIIVAREDMLIATKTAKTLTKEYLTQHPYTVRAQLARIEVDISPQPPYRLSIWTLQTDESVLPAADLSLGRRFGFSTQRIKHNQLGTVLLEGEIS